MTQVEWEVEGFDPAKILAVRDTVKHRVPIMDRFGYKLRVFVASRRSSGDYANQLASFMIGERVWGNALVIDEDGDIDPIVLSGCMLATCTDIDTETEIQVFKGSRKK